MEETMLAAGTILNSRYQIIQPIGAGGMGAVYLANDLRLNQSVALKENNSGDPRQFQREASLLANLRHPHLPRVLDYFIEPNAQYLVMDFIAGEDLQTRIDRGGASSEAQVLGWFKQILDAVAYLHRCGVIHRDIKPQNIIITPQGHAVLVDFGIAKIYQPGQRTASSIRMGTPGYAPPEQYHHGTDQRSDIYSLGATLYALLAGGPPPDALALEKGTATLMPLQRLNPGISAKTEQAVMRAMALSPQQRYQSVDEMRNALYPSGHVTTTWPVTQTAPTVLAPSRVSGVGVIVAVTGIFLLIVMVILSLTVLWTAWPRSSPTPSVYLALTTETHTPIFSIATNTPLVLVTPTDRLATWTRTPTLLTPTSTRTPTRTRLAVLTPTATRPPAPGLQKRLDFQNGLIVTDLASGNQHRLTSDDEVATSAVWSLDGERILLTWSKKGTVRKLGDLYACGYDWVWDPVGGWMYKTRWCRYPPNYFPSEYGGSVRLLSKTGQTIADLATGSPEPKFVGDPQITYSDVVWAPDAKRIALLYKQADGNRCPFVGNPDVTGLRKLKDCEADDHPRFWSTDGKWLITWSERGLKFFAYEVDGGRRVALEELGDVKLYDQRYFPWRTINKPVCKDSNFWSCE